MVVGTTEMACTGGAGFGVGVISRGRGRLMARLLLPWCLCLAAPFVLAAPAMVSVVPSDSPVSGGDAFHLTVTYDVAMDTAVTPVISFPTAGEDPGAFLVPTTSTWLDATTFRQNYGTASMVVNISPVDVAVSGAKDTVGAVQSPGFQADVFEILYIPPPHVVDMKGVVDGGILVHPAGSGHVLTDADIGKTVTFVIRYDIASDYGGCPNGVPLNYLCTNLVFTNTGGTPLTLGNVTSTWANRNRYIVTWTIADGDEQFDSINVLIAGGVGRKDDPDNKNTDFELTGVFSIDTRNPSVLAVAPSTAVLRSDLTTQRGGSILRAGELFTLTITFSEPMDTASTPVLSFPNQPGLAAVLTPTGGSWTDSTHYVQSFTVGAGNLVLPAVDVQVTGARDAHGNPQNLGLLSGVFAVALGAAMAVPTLSSWGLVLLAGLLGLAAIPARRRGVFRGRA